ncbi:MAG: HDOD domain-containing protein [Bdellovibrionota bacterium]
MEDNLSITKYQFIEKLKKALQTSGDFPACTKTINELVGLTNNPNAPSSKLTEYILKDPTLSTKILNFVNSAFFQRGVPITTISQAIIHMGLKQLAELCSSFTLIQKFLPESKKNENFALTLEKLITTSLFTSILNSANVRSKSKDEETGYLLGTFSELGLMLTAYYFPKLFENALQKSLNLNIPLDDAIKELTGFEPLEISLEVLDSLKIPAIYTSSITVAMNFKNNTLSLKALGGEQKLIKNLLAAQDISSTIMGQPLDDNFETIIKNVSKKYEIPENTLQNSFKIFTKEFPEYCSSMKIDLPKINTKLPKISTKEDLNINLTPQPTSILTIDNLTIADLTNNKLTNNDSTNNDLTNNDLNDLTVDDYLKQIDESIHSDEPITSIITKIMETLVFSLNFERALLLVANADKTKFQGHAIIGDNVADINPADITIPINITSPNVASKCYFNGQITTYGTLILPKDTSCLAVPIGIRNYCTGVIYASFTDPNNNTISLSTIKIAKDILKELIKITSGDYL